MTSGLVDKRNAAMGIWWLALGYFVFYIPYSALVKALSSGLLGSSEFVNGSVGSVNGLEFLPAVLIGTVITMPLILLCLGWYRYMGRRNVLGFNMFCPSRWTIYSGVAFAFIIVTTTLTYSFHGVSILFALLLMRGGVLIMSPLMDKFFSRPVHWFSWAGLWLSVLALSIALVQVPEYTLSGMVLLNLCGYLAGYMFRLQFMTRCAKDVDESVNRRFLVEENAVAMIVLMVVPGVIALLQIGEAGTALSFGFTTFLSTDLAWPALIIGGLYGCLGIFGSLIYLNRRENTFVIPVNRCSSLLSGVVASAILFIWLDGNALSAAQLSGAAIIILALAVMSLFDRRHMGKDGLNPLQRVFLFICDFNRTRSPMAAAICNDEIAKRLGFETEVSAQSMIYAKSAGLNLPADRDMHHKASDALKALAVPVPEHQANMVNSYDVHRAEKILCMTSAQKQQLIAKFPWATEKTISLDLEQDIHASKAAGHDQFVDIARSIRQKIAPLFGALGLEHKDKQLSQV